MNYKHRFFKDSIAIDLNSIQKRNVGNISDLKAFEIMYMYWNLYYMYLIQYITKIDYSEDLYVSILSHALYEPLRVGYGIHSERMASVEQHWSV